MNRNLAIAAGIGFVVGYNVVTHFHRKKTAEQIQINKRLVELSTYCIDTMEKADIPLDEFDRIVLRNI